ncbi:chorismate mutase aro7 [Ciborinia camelliae]|nr:chorismate mutase aro7 [Ciborinia camelliae]
MDAAIDLSDASKALDLSNIRFQLIRLEDTITFHLIERPSHSPPISSGPPLSFLDWLLHSRETLDSQIRRFQSPDEYPFFPDALKSPILQPLHYPAILHPNDVNVNAEIKEHYIKTFLPNACLQTGRSDRGEKEENYGSAATCDINCLQALSRRIHFGKFVAESKFQAEEEAFTKMIQEGDREGLGRAITNEKVELQVLERLRLKARTYGTDPSLNNGNGEQPQGKINVEAVEGLYRDFVIPLTKVVEVEYLMQRLDKKE